MIKIFVLHETDYHSQLTHYITFPIAKREFEPATDFFVTSTNELRIAHVLASLCWKDHPKYVWKARLNFPVIPELRLCI